MNSALETVGSYQQVSSQTTSIPRLNNAGTYSRLHFSRKFAQTILITPFTTGALLTFRLAKLLTWDLGKKTAWTALGYHTDATAFFDKKYVNTAKLVRDLLLLPSQSYTAFKNIFTMEENIEDDLIQRSPQFYLSIPHTTMPDQFSSKTYGFKTVEVIKPIGIKEFAAKSDGELNCVMASHFLRSDVGAIIFGKPNVASFITEDKGDGDIQTVKIDAFSVMRKEMSFHNTNGIMQSGIFFVPINLPIEAIDAFKEKAAEKEGRADISCVNTNCRVLNAMGLSIEGEDMEKIIFPTSLLELLMFRRVFYTDKNGKKHLVHFDIINTTNKNLEQVYQDIDEAIITTQSRHARRNKEPKEVQEARGIAGKQLSAEEKIRLAKLPRIDREALNLTRRKITVSVPSRVGNLISEVWGRHTLYKIDFSDIQDKIADLFKDLEKLTPFPQQEPDFATRVKRDYVFSQPIIDFLHRHMMGRVDTLYLNVDDLIESIKSMEGGRLNFVILDDEVVLAKINANGSSDEMHRKTADWALSKHALLAKRKPVRSSGEIWYDSEQNKFYINKNSGTYQPSEEHVKVTVLLANEIFRSERYNNAFVIGPDA